MFLLMISFETFSLPNLLKSTMTHWVYCWQHSFQTQPGPRAGFRVSGFDRVARVNYYFFKSKRRRFRKKNKKQKSTGCNQIFDRFLPGPRSTSRARFQNYCWQGHISSHLNFHIWQLMFFNPPIINNAPNKYIKK
jgi:hypothetical protein